MVCRSSIVQHSTLKSRRYLDMCAAGRDLFRSECPETLGSPGLRVASGRVALHRHQCRCILSQEKMPSASADYCRYSLLHAVLSWYLLRSCSASAVQRSAARHVLGGERGGGRHLEGSVPKTTDTDTLDLTLPALWSMPSSPTSPVLAHLYLPGTWAGVGARPRRGQEANGGPAVDNDTNHGTATSPHR